MKYKGYFYFPFFPPGEKRYRLLIYKGKSVIPPNPLKNWTTCEREREREKKKRDLKGIKV